VFFTDIGIYLDGKVLPTSLDMVKNLKTTAKHSSVSRCRINIAEPTEPPGVLLQLSLAVEAVNEKDCGSASRLEECIAASQRLIDETNQLFEKKGLAKVRLIA
jgi:hypothetical protein